MIVIYGCIDMADVQHVYLRIFYALLLNPSMSAQKSTKPRRQSLYFCEISFSKSLWSTKIQASGGGFHIIVIYGCINVADLQHVYIRILYALLLNPSMSAQKSPKAHRQSL